MGGRRFRVINERAVDYFPMGEILEIAIDDGTDCPKFRNKEGRMSFFYVYWTEEIDEEGNVIRTFKKGDTLKDGTPVNYPSEQKKRFDEMFSGECSEAICPKCGVRTIFQGKVMYIKCAGCGEVLEACEGKVTVGSNVDGDKISYNTIKQAFEVEKNPSIPIYERIMALAQTTKDPHTHFCFSENGQIVAGRVEKTGEGHCRVIMKRNGGRTSERAKWLLRANKIYFGGKE